MYCLRYCIVEQKSKIIPSGNETIFQLNTDGNGPHAESDFLMNLTKVESWSAPPKIRIVE